MPVNGRDEVGDRGVLTGFEAVAAEPEEGPSPPLDGPATIDGVVGYAWVIDAHDRHVGALQVRDHTECQRELDDTGYHEVSERHGRDGLGKMKRCIQRGAVSRLEECRL